MAHFKKCCLEHLKRHVKVPVTLKVECAFNISITVYRQIEEFNIKIPVTLKVVCAFKLG